MTEHKASTPLPPVPKSSPRRSLGRLLVPAVVFLGGAFGTTVRYELLAFGPWTMLAAL